ncbi:Crp/Fnr family transcriptional regulator [Enterococcus sp. BWM-S5]|uniref:Crp/Fnr family transcriptional regulator n=1 Tax=Enterococcus larvae TaxID=2794352 RepID=A0ABS4CPP8_9ENTE|nr:Crp/Fnr family transcriptional regulator [Enterococcus larvae]MBP1048101.1 Crp/Fnr family transcriptional regulator [Enterococcus larvae]
MEKNAKTSKLSIINEHPYFSNLDVENRELLEENMYCRSYKKGQVLFDTGDKRDRIFFLNKGLIRIERLDDTASYNFLEFISEKQSFPLLDMFESEKYYFSAVAITDIEVCYISSGIFERIVQLDLEQLKIFNTDLNRLVKKQMRRIQYCITSKAKQRVKNTLSILMEDLGEREDDKIVIPHPILINDISKYSGTTRETVGQTIKELIKNKKITYKYKELVFIDIDYFKLGK